MTSRSSRDVRPVHVEFDRCGRKRPGGGWTRCKTAHLCQYHGCQVMQAEEMREREIADRGAVGDGHRPPEESSVSISATAVSSSPDDQRSERIGAERNA